MPRVKNDPYLCPSCGKVFDRRAYIRRHFYDRKEHCPKIFQNITLTDEIKQFVLQNRKWHQPDTSSSNVPAIINSNNGNNVNTIINNYNTINNFIAGIDTIDKLKHYISYKSIDMIALEDKVDQKYSEQYERLMSDRYQHFELNMDNIYDIIDEISQVDCENVEELNFVFDDKGQKVFLFDGDWKHLRFKCAIKTILSIIKSSYTNAYEAYLIRRMKNPSVTAYKKQKAHELLQEYYKFLGSNDILPGVKDEYSTGDIDSLEDDIRDEYYEVYKKTVNNMTKGEENKIQKEIFDIIKRNSKKNIEELNKKIIGLFQIDEDYKKQVLDLKLK